MRECFTVCREQAPLAASSSAFQANPPVRRPTASTCTWKCPQRPTWSTLLQFEYGRHRKVV
jgi:hypothetical protein